MWLYVWIDTVNGKCYTLILVLLVPEESLRVPLPLPSLFKPNTINSTERREEKRKH